MLTRCFLSSLSIPADCMHSEIVNHFVGEKGIFRLIGLLLESRLRDCDRLIGGGFEDTRTCGTRSLLTRDTIQVALELSTLRSSW